MCKFRKIYRIFVTENEFFFKSPYFFICAQVIYALNYSIAKDLMPHYIKPLGLVMMRITGALILFWTLSLFSRKEKVEMNDLKRMMLLALFGVAVNQAFFIYGLSLTKPINSAIIMVSNPIAVMLFTIFVFKEKITTLKLTGLGFGVIGALTLLLFKAHGSFAIGSETIAGDLMTLVNSLSLGCVCSDGKTIYAKIPNGNGDEMDFLIWFYLHLPFWYDRFVRR